MAAQAPVGPRERGRAARGRAGHGRRRRRGSARLGLEHARRVRAEDRGDAARRAERASTPAPRSTSTSPAAGVGPGNPWCASFVTWSLGQAGHKMPGGGWAAVQTWVRNAEAKQNDLQIVSADQARPGDIVAYDWGGQDDFGSDGHIGFLASNVQDGKFTALEGNNQDAVMKVPRHVTGGATSSSSASAATRRRRAGAAAPRPAGGAGVADAAAAAAGAAGGATPTPATTRRRSSSPPGSAGEAEKRGLPQQLPVMASLVESGVKNLNYGDADSVGFFQMRVGIWNQGEYAGFPEKPELQIKWFLDQAEAVKKQRIAARPAGQRPEAVRRLDRRHRAPRRAVPRPLPAAPRRGQRPAPKAGDPRRPRPPPGRPPAPAAAAAAALADAAAERGRRAARRPARRRWRRSRRRRSTSARRTSGAARRRRPASTAPASCSGPTRKAGHPDPARDRRADRRAQRHAGRPRRPQARRPRVLRRRRGNVHHVGMSMGGDKFLHAPHTGDVVKVSSLDEPYYAEQFAGGRRFDHAARGRRAAAGRAAPRPPPRRPAIDPKAVAEAQAAVARDAAEVSRTTPASSWRSRRRRSARHATRAVPEGDRPQGTPRPPRPGRRRRRRPRPPPPAADAAAAPAPAAAAPPGRRGDPARGRRRRPADRAARRHLRRLPGQQRVEGRAREVAGQAGREGRPAAGAAGHGLARRVRRQEPQLRRRRLASASSRCASGSGTRATTPATRDNPELQAKWFIDQALAVKTQAIAARRRRLRQGPVEVGRVDRRHRAPRRAVPRPLPAAPRARRAGCSG